MSQLHIVSFDIPYPANYGGIIDVYHQIKCLSEKGVQITLHCFQYAGKKRQPHLEELCSKVYYYKRKIGVAGISTSLPYIVYSRRDSLLLDRLTRADGPIIFEGIHCCYYLNHPSLKDKTKVVRCMNIEHEYYKMLSSQASLPSKLFFKEEAKRLKRFEPVLKHAQHLLSISSHDHKHFQDQFKTPLVTKITAFHGNKLQELKPALGSYSLFHGSLDVIENEKAALFLINEVFLKFDYPLIIAGKNPTQKLIKAAEMNSNTTLIANPDVAQLQQLISHAQIHLMMATQASGLKLKLLTSLFNGRHVIANHKMMTEKQLEPLVSIASSPREWQEAIQSLSVKIFDKEDQDHRANSLKDFTDECSILKLMKTLNLGT
ncbi:glycosyltransferase family protein [Nonlabens marinus]|uniref:Glycosyltransferase n=1 Tax=Nonlabens marinus S1-08 TaxID=1454201 RepID=W8VQ84_9FLAO|nr:hypothetical protein [Nonlabens marinus]BAO55514.1 glycosyltransferase [Nonlabens marinus S1-08]